MPNNNYDKGLKSKNANFWSAFCKLIFSTLTTTTTIIEIGTL